MPTSEQVEYLRSMNMTLSEALHAELEDFVATLDIWDGNSSRDALLDFVPTLVEVYGDASAAIAADWFEDVYGVRAVLASGMAREHVEKGVRTAAGHLYTSTPELVTSSLSKKTDKWVRNTGRDSVATSAEANGMMWARVPRGGKTCAFCLILASRDAVYTSKKQAISTRSGERFHGHCDCEAIAVNSWGDFPDGYDPQKYYDLYEDAVKSADNPSDIKSIAASLKNQHPELVTDDD